jgi:NAD-dependent dihydropyrimidine dehydrogenase PreA subunit
MVSSMPRPVDFTASNFYAVLDTSACNGCGKCVRRCHMNAVVYDKKARKAKAIDLKRCIGCGVCVPECKTGALGLKMKNPLYVPPMDHDDLYETIMRNKRGLVGQLGKIGKAVAGLKV